MRPMMLPLDKTANLNLLIVKKYFVKMHARIVDKLHNSRYSMFRTPACLYFPPSHFYVSIENLKMCTQIPNETKRNNKTN